MKVILKKDMHGLGYRNDVVEVKNGYGRNFLIPRGLAFTATESAIKTALENAKQFKRKEENILKEANSLATTLNDMTIVIGTKAGSNGKIFGSVTTIQIASVLKEKGFDVDRKKIKIKGDIKELGDYNASISLYRGVDANINISVIQE